MNKSAAGSCHFSYSHSGISASGIGWLGRGANITLARALLSYYRENKLVVFPHITTASPKCLVRYTVVTDTGHCFYFATL